ncbi:MAG: lamin tail domain-containing protein [Elusimicrobiota bacterium]|nr:lamin tail domain-containing protein [Elusimicrobiota bacterium]
MKLRKYILFVFAAFFITQIPFLYADTWANHVVISEIATGSTADAYDEFVELYNPTDSAINISGWKLQYSPAANESFSTTIRTIIGGPIQPYSYYLIAGAGYVGTYDEKGNQWGLAADAGHIRITSDGTLAGEKDRIGWGTASYAEGFSPAPKHEPGFKDGSIERKAFSSSTQASMEGGSDYLMGNGEDSDNNGNDFIVRTARDPQSLSDGTIEPVPPLAPTGFAVTDPNNDGTLKLEWTPAAYSEGTYGHFEIYRGASTSTITSYAATTDSTTLVYWDGLNAGDSILANVTYYYQVSAVAYHPAVVNEGAKTDPPVLAFPTDKIPPAKITGLTALDTQKGNEIRLEWTPSSALDIDKYGIYYLKTNPFGNLALAEKKYYIDASTNITVVTGLVDGQLYYFSVTGKDINGNEDKTQFEQVSATPSDQTAPAKVMQNTPVNEGSGTKINLSWTAVSDSDLAGYKIFHTTNTPSGTVDVYTLDFFAAVSPSLTQKTITGLMPNVTYWFVLTSRDEVPNETNLIGAAYFKNIFPVDDPPGQITTLSAINEGSGGKINLSWTVSPESDVVGYNCYQAVYSSVTVSVFEYKCFVSTPAVMRTMTGLTDGVTYYFGITAVDGASQEGVISSTSSAIPTDTVPPSGVSGVTVTRLLPPTTGGVLMLSWTNPGDADLDGTKIYSSTGGTSGVILSSLVATLAKTTDYYCHSSLTNGLTYYYIIRPVDETGNESTNTDIYQGRPLDSYPPAASAGFAGMDMGTGFAVHLSWTQNSEGDLKGYNIYRDSAPAAFISGATFYIDAALSSSGTYYYTIRARDTSDNLSVPSSVSLFVNDVSVLPPYDISVAAPATGRSVRLSWKTDGSPRQIWLYRGTADSTTAVFGVEPSTRLAASATFYLDAGLTDKTSYYYGIKAVNYIYDSVVTKSTNTDIYTAFPYDSVAPAVVSGLRAVLTGTDSTRDIKVMWNKVTKNEDGSECGDLAGYEVEWLGSSGAVWGDTKVPVILGDTLEWTHTNLSAITYHYRIRACDGSAPAHYSLFGSSIAIYCDAVLNYAFEVDDVSAVTFTPNGDGIADSLDINFTLNQSSTTVELRVYSSTGGFVAELSSATYQAALSTSVAWSPSGLADGIYSVRIYINGSEFSSISVTIQGSAQIPPAANNYPNPFIMSRDGSTKIRWMMASPSPVKIAVYNAVGMLVKTWKISQNELTANYQQSGQWYELPWDGRNGKGRKVGSGIYICLIRGGGVDEKIKIAVIR